MSYTTLPDPEQLQRTIEAVKARGIKVELVETKEAALAGCGPSSRPARS